MKDIKDVFKDVFTIDAVEVDTDDYWDIEDILGAEFVRMLNGKGMDDFSFIAYASNTDNDPRIHGQFRFCVYGGVRYEDLKSLLENAKSDILTIEGLYHPVQTPGISHNGVYEDRDTTYIGGKFTIREEKK